MGFFSWKTSDTNRSISNMYSSKDTFTVYLLCPNGQKLREDNYEGYGVFGGKDVYALVAMWNAPEMCKDENGEWLPENETRIIGIDLAFSGKNLEYGIKLVENEDLDYDNVDVSERCEYQGYFYDDIMLL